MHRPQRPLREPGPVCLPDRLLPALAGGLLTALGAAAADASVRRGDYEVGLGPNGLVASWRGTQIVCANHLTVNRPGWQGVVYAGRAFGGPGATIEPIPSGLRARESVPALDGEAVEEIQVDEDGITVTLRLTVRRELSGHPGELALAVFPAAEFAGGRYRGEGLLGDPEWQTLPATPPTETGPGTKLLLDDLRGLGLQGRTLSVNVECLDGPAPSLYDMRSRDYGSAERNLWLLYSGAVGTGEFMARARFSVRPNPAPAPAVAAAAVTVAEGGQHRPLAAILVPAEAHPLERAAAAELQAYLRRMSGTEVPVRTLGGVPVDAPLPARGVLFVGPLAGVPAGSGLAALAGAASLDAPGPGYDRYAVRSGGGNVLVSGANHRATVYAIYRLLETLGCRFYARDLEIVPGPGAVEIPDGLDIRDQAAFEWRAMLGTIAPMKASLSPGEWEASVAGMDVPKMMAFPKGGFWHHTMGFLLPAADLAREKPECLALIGGQRRVVEPAVQQYCLSNPELQRRMAERVLAWIAADPDKLYYPVHYGDVAAFCECDACRALYAEQGGVTDAVIAFDNRIAREVAARYPGKFLTILAYHSTRRPPVKVRPEPNLLIVYCAIVECQGRPWTAPVNLRRDVCKDLEGWVAVHPLGAKGIMSFDYPTTYYYAGFPYPALYAYVENLRYYHRVGLRGAYVCGLGSWKHLEHLYSYVMSRILWDPDQDLGRLIDEFCTAWYGPAAKPMRDYIEHLHRGAMASTSEGVMDCHAGPGQRYFRELYTPEFLTRAEDLLGQAETLAADPVLRRRVQKEAWGVWFVDLFLNARATADLVPADTLAGVEQREPLLADVRKTGRFLRLHRTFNRPWSVEPRRGFTVTSLTGVSPAAEPWWNDPALRLLMDDPQQALAARRQAGAELGKSLVTLENAALKVTVVPALGGRLWRLYDKRVGQDLLWRGTLPASALERGLPPSPYVNLGGYEEYTGEAFGSAGWAERYTAEVGADGQSVTLTASLASGARVTRRLRLTADPAGVEVDSELANAGQGPLPAAVLRVHPQFRLGPGAAAPALTVAAEGTERDLTPAPGETFLRGPDKPKGEWRLRLPGLRVCVTNRFAPDDVEACLLYRGPEFANLELFSPVRTLAPGDTLRIRHSYTVTPLAGP